MGWRQKTEYCEVSRCRFLLFVISFFADYADFFSRDFKRV
jgi:hypothetical protein